jgi:flagellar FliL protein
MAEDSEKDTNEKSGDSSASVGSKSPIVTILLLLNTVGLVAIAYFQYSFMEQQRSKPDLAELLKQSNKSMDALDEDRPVETMSKETLVNLESFTVNLAQGDGPRRYVRMNAVLKMSEDSELTEIESRKPQIRDTIIGILNSKKPEDILKRDGKLYLKEQIKSAINAYLVDGNVVDIFYVGFQIN